MNIIRRRSTGTEIQNIGRFKLTHFHYKQRSFDDGLSSTVTLLNSRPLMNQRQRRGALMVSCENLLADSEIYGVHEGSMRGFKGRQAGNRKSGGIFTNPFKSDRERMDQLTDLLNLYGQNGIPEQSGLLSFRVKSENTVETDCDIYYLEDHWKSIVSNAEDLPKKVQNQNDAIWELLQTEVFYLRRLKVITDLFLSCLCNLQTECLLTEIDTSRMFSNIVEVFTSNHQFWIDHLLPMLNFSRNTHQPLNPMLMKDGFLLFDQIFHPYVKYCLEHSTCLQYVKEKHKDNELFKAYVVWCETHKDCERLRLMDLLVKPMQRLTKYSLLLKAILKKTDSEEQKQALKLMNSQVEYFVCGVDATLRRRHEQEKLSSIVSRIESYDAIDCNNDEAEKLLKDYTNLDLTCPMHGCSNHYIRHLLVEGSLKLKDSQASKVDVHCFLFTDILLICKSINKKTSDKVKVIRQPFIIDRVVTQELKDGSGFILIYLNEFRVASAMLILYTPDTKTWLNYIKKAQELYLYARTASIPSEPQEVIYYRNFEDDEDYDFPSMALLTASQSSPRSSSRSSLVLSHSGSVDMSDPNSSGSLQLIAPVSTPNLLQNPQNQQQPPRAISFELGDLRNPSLTVEDLDSFVRSQSVDNRSPISVTVTSPRPERRAFLLRNVKSSSGMAASYQNTLTVNVPYHQIIKPSSSQTPSSPPLIQLPVLSSPTRTSLTTHTHHTTTYATSLSSVKRSLPPRPPSPTPPHRSFPIASSNKPPLVKSKHIDGKNITGLLMHSAPPSGGPSPVYSFDIEGGNEPLLQQRIVNVTNVTNTQLTESNVEVNNSNVEDQEGVKSGNGRSHQKRNERTCRAERRYHTADSIENMKKEKDASIHKRLSWNYGQSAYSHAHSGNKSVPSHCERILCNKHFNKCLSSESVYSSSGFSSTGSVPLSVGSSECEQCGAEILDYIQEMDSVSDTLTITQNDFDDTKAAINCNSGEEASLASKVDATNTINPKCNTNLNLPGSNIKIDISEVKDGISSVQISLSGQNSKPSKADLKKMKEFLLSSYNVEAS